MINITHGVQTGLTKASPTPPAGLEPFSGEWNSKTASHLLRRLTFGASYREVQQAIKDGLDKTIDKLFRPIRNVPEPINYYFKNDPKVPVGETWVGKAYTPGVSGLSNARRNSLFAWIVGRMLEERYNIMPKLLLFWHNHLVIDGGSYAELSYNYILLLRKHALGNFRQLMKDITIEPAMLRYLNGNTSTARAPNENYARELMELFTLGKGPLTGPGDYTTYTEHDIKEIAKALTGWYYNSKLFIGLYKSGRHDKTTKKLSHRFNGITIKDQGSGEYKAVIDIIFRREEVAPFIVRKLYVWYLNSEITPEIEANVIQPLATIFRDSDYEVEPVLRALFSSQHFFNECAFGSMLKSPMDHFMHVFQTLKLSAPKSLTERYRFWRSIWTYQNTSGQAWFNQPSVAGWPAYYQEPVFYKYWISPVALSIRKKIVGYFINSRVKVAKKYYGLQLVEVVDEFKDPFDPNEVIRELCKLLFSQAPSDKQIEYLKQNALIPGLPDFEWTEEYGDYADNPQDEAKKNAVLKRLRKLMELMLNMPEFYIQ